ncbi:MAG: hypothetical protein ACK482_13120 [Aphanizomenon sp.]
MLKNFKALISATLSTHQAVFYRKVRSLLPDPTTPTPTSAIMGHPNQKAQTMNNWW